MTTGTKEKKVKKRRVRTPEEKQARRASQLAAAATSIRERYRGVRLTIRQMPYSRTFTTEQKRTALKDFGANTDAVCMSKKLFDSEEPAVKRVREVVSEINLAYTCREYTLPHPERGVRLIKQGKYSETDHEVQAGDRKADDPGKYMERLAKKLQGLSESLQRAAVALEAEMPVIRERERKRQGALYDVQNYKFSAVNAYQVEWQFTEVDVPHYLLQLDPSLVAAAEQRVQAQFEQACQMKEQEMAEELFLALDSLIERLSGTRTDGKVKIFRNDTAGKLVGFIQESEQQLQESGIGKGPLQRAFAKLKNTIQATDGDSLASRLRDSDTFRDVVRDGMEQVANSVLSNAVVKPKRRILRQRAKSMQLHKD